MQSLLSPWSWGVSPSSVDVISKLEVLGTPYNLYIYGGFLTWTWPIIHFISSSSPLSGECEAELKFMSQIMPCSIRWPAVLSRSHPGAPPRVISVEQKTLLSPRKLKAFQKPCVRNWKETNIYSSIISQGWNPQLPSSSWGGRGIENQTAFYGDWWGTSVCLAMRVSKHHYQDRMPGWGSLRTKT